MNHPGTSGPPAVSATHAPLLENIRAARESLGDGLNDGEFTLWLQRTALPTEAGFAFLSVSEGFVTLTVPPQDLADWYPASGWMAPGKETVARAIADRYGLSLCEPPDQGSTLSIPGSASATLHHHLEFTTPGETVIVAHPCYLKVRLFGAAPALEPARTAQNPPRFGPGVLQDLSALYRT